MTGMGRASVGAILLVGLIAPTECSNQSRPIAAAARPDPGLAPILTLVPARIAVGANLSAIVALTGEHFEPGANVSLANALYTYAFGAPSLTVKNPTRIEFDAGAVEPGTYAVSVRNPSGRRSNALTVAVAVRAQGRR